MTNSNIINIVLVMLVLYLVNRPKPIENPYYLREVKASIKRQDSLVNLINDLQTKRNERKDSVKVIDSIYIDISKDELRNRIRHIDKRHNLFRR